MMSCIKFTFIMHFPLQNLFTMLWYIGWSNPSADAFALRVIYMTYLWKNMQICWQCHSISNSGPYCLSYHGPGDILGFTWHSREHLNIRAPAAHCMNVCILKLFNSILQDKWYVDKIHYRCKQRSFCFLGFFKQSLLYHNIGCYVTWNACRDNTVCFSTCHSGPWYGGYKWRVGKGSSFFRHA